MSNANKTSRSKPGSTTAGLVSLLYHLIHATSQGQLDPALTRDLGQMIYSEIDMLQSAASPGGLDIDLLREATSRFEETLLRARSSLLTDARKHSLSPDPV